MFHIIHKLIWSLLYFIFRYFIFKYCLGWKSLTTPYTRIDYWIKDTTTHSSQPHTVQWQKQNLEAWTSRHQTTPYRSKQIHTYTIISSCESLARNSLITPVSSWYISNILIPWIVWNRILSHQCGEWFRWTSVAGYFTCYLSFV